MARRLLPILLLTVLALFTGRVVSAQQPTPSVDAPPAVSDAPPQSYDTPPAITVVDGNARLIRQGQSQTAPPNMPLIEGDRLVTENGRVEVTFADGSRVHLDRNTTVDFLSVSLLRLLDGRVILVASGNTGERPAVDYQIDAQGGSTRIQAAGSYRVAMKAGELELDVITGRAALATDQGSVQVEAGERSFARNGQAPADPVVFNSATMDAFDQWSEQQRSTEVASQSTQYLPSNMSAYASDFDQNGRWENDATYGYVWYPTVTAGWRPYYNGYWDNVGPYGWTWIGYDRWAWPTHHFGRWGFNAGSWFWIPQRYWAPAWVSWGYYPGYVAWAPLGFYNAPVFSLYFGFGHSHGFYNPWLCWTVVPHGHFGHGYHVSHYAVAGGHLPAAARTGFVVRRTGPERPVAVARSGGAVRGGTGYGSATPRALTSVSTQARPRDSMFASGRAVPRGTSPGVSSYQASRRDSRSLSYATPSAPGSYRPGVSRPSNYAGVARGGGSRPSNYPGGGPSRPSTYPGVARGGDSRPSDYPGVAVHRGEARPLPAAPYNRGIGVPSGPGDRPSAMPRGGTYSAPPAPRGGQYSAPGYSSPRYSSPGYSSPAFAPRPSQPSYSGPRYSAPGYAAPRSSPPSGGGYAAPRSGGGGGQPAPSSRPAPSGGSSRGGGGRGRG